MTTAVRQVRLGRRRVLVDGVPRLLTAGEVHYFRLHRPDWGDRLDRLLEAGCDAVATYVPWLVHELPDGSVDLEGRTSEYRDITGFLDLAHARGLLVVARPGPFVMAELKNEGIPFRVYSDLPHVQGQGWDGAPATTRTLDYLAPDYLTAVRGWYAEVLPLLARRQVTRGGPVAAVQLDNEVGMLSWVSNCPDLTDGVCADLADWATRRLGRDGATARYGADPGDLTSWSALWRSGGGQAQLAVHHDLGDYHRDRYARYVDALRREAERYGLDEVPLLVNLHGTGEGRGRTYPIGISQLYRSYSGVPQMTSGSDHYVGDLTVENVADLYVGNAFMAAVHDDDQPLTSLEFEAGGGDYGEDLSRATPPEAVDLKTRLFVAQGNRLVSYYLFAGGHNPPLDEPVGDGNDRIAFTGERHGFAAPVDPEGRLSATFAATAGVVRAVRGMASVLADSDEEHDDVVLGFVPDHYLTEYAHPAADRRRHVVTDLERFRGMGSRDVLARALLLGGFSFGAVDLQADGHGPTAALRSGQGPAVALASPPVLGRAVQQRLVDHLAAGGRLLLHGVLPVVDDDGTPCTLLADALGLAAVERVEGAHLRFPSVRPTAWRPGPEVRVGVLQRLRVEPSADVEPLLADVASGSPVAVHWRGPSGGQAVVVACDAPCDLDLWRALWRRLDVTPRHTHDAPWPGVVVTSTVDGRGQRLLHLLNVAPSAQDLVVSRDGLALLDGHRVHLPARGGLAVPMDLDLLGAGVLRWSTAQLDGAPRTEQGVVVLPLRVAGPDDVMTLETTADVAASGGAVVDRRGDGVRVTWPGVSGPLDVELRVG